MKREKHRFFSRIERIFERKGSNLQSAHALKCYLSFFHVFFCLRLETENRKWM